MEDFNSISFILIHSHNANIRKYNRGYTVDSDKNQAISCKGFYAVVDLNETTVIIMKPTKTLDEDKLDEVNNRSRMSALKVGRALFNSVADIELEFTLYFN